MWGFRGGGGVFHRRRFGCFGGVRLLVCLRGCGVVLSVGGVGVVLAVFLCLCLMFSGVGVIGNEAGDISTRGRVRPNSGSGDWWGSTCTLDFSGMIAVSAWGRASFVERCAERLDDNKCVSPPCAWLCENKERASRVGARSGREGIVYLAARFSLRFFLLSALSFLVIGFFLALRMPISIAS